jgi:hypothetical protein
MQARTGCKRATRSALALLAALALAASGLPGAALARPAAAPAADGEREWLYWDSLCAVCVRQYSLLGSRALQLDGAGRQHLAYGGKGLYYATAPAGGAWTFTLVDGSRHVGAAAALALTSAGQPAIAYHDPTAGRLRYAEWTGSAWLLENVASAPGDLGQSGRFSLAFDAANQPAMAYYDLAAGDLRYAWRSAGQWHTQAVDTAGDVGGASSLAFDRAGSPAISYLDATARTLKLARLAGGAWSTSTVAAGGEASALAFDPDNQPHMAHAVSVETPAGSGLWQVRRLDYTRWTGGAWTTEAVLTDEPVAARDVSLALDSGRTPHIGYRDRSSHPAYATRQSGGAWEFSSAPPSQVAVGVSLALAPNGTPRAAFMEDEGSVFLAQPGSGSWPSTLVDPFVYLPGTPSLAVDLANGVHLLYEDEAGQQYARLAGGAWLTSTVAAGGRKGVVALDLIGGVHALFDHSGILEYARLDGGNWTIRTVSSQTTFRHHLAVTAGGVPSAVYWAANTRDLVFAAWGGSSWLTQTVASPIDTGKDNALALDGSGYPHLAYTTRGTGKLDYLQWTGSNWVTTTVEASGVNGYALGLALDAQGRPHLGYFLGASRTLMHAHFDGAAWVKEPAVALDPAGPADARFSFALDPTGRPHFAYYDPADGALRYTRRLAAGWQADSLGYVADLADLGSETEINSLALAPDGHIHLAYVHNQRGILYAEARPGWRAFLPRLGR